MAQTVILAEQTLELNAGENEIPCSCSFTVGETYRVVWGEIEYTCTAWDASGVGEIFTAAIGNASLVDLGDTTDEPFVIVPIEDEGILLIIVAMDATHTVAIYQEVESEGTSIVLKDRNGNDVTHEGIETVTFDTPTEGVQVTFTYGVVAPKLEVPVTFAEGDMPIVADEKTLMKEIVLLKPDNLIPENIRNGESVAGVMGTFLGDTEEVTVDLSMVDGDQVIEPSADGKVLSKVVITKPETLVPENIAEGVNVAGIIGTLAGGGGGTVVCARGEFTATGTTHTLSHGLGVVPLFIYIKPASTSDAARKTAYCILNFYGMSQALADAMGVTEDMQYGEYYNSTLDKPIASAPDYVIETSYVRTAIHNATEDTVVFGSSGNNDYILVSGVSYQWIAIGLK